MKEPYGEGLASHTGSESCACGRKAGSEALTGAHAGGVLSRDMLKKIRVPTSSMMAEGNIGGCEKRAFIGLCEVRDPRMYGNSTREIREALPTPNEGGSGPVGEGDEPCPCGSVRGAQVTLSRMVEPAEICIGIARYTS